MSNEEWQSPTDPESKIAKMKDGTTHLAYKAEHVVDLKTGLVLAAEIYPADQADNATLQTSVMTAQINLARADSAAQIDEVATDKGYHKIETLADLAEAEYRTYIPEQEQPHGHTWTDKPAEHQKAYRSNRRRVQGKRGKRLQRLRSERVERSFAHVCETGGGRRSWLHGVIKISKRYLMQVAGAQFGNHDASVVRSGNAAELARVGWGVFGAGRVVLQCVALFWASKRPSTLRW